VLEFVSCDGVAFSEQDWKSIDEVREKYKYNRRIETDFHFFLIKEIVSQVHSRASQFMQMKLASAELDSCCYQIRKLRMKNVSSVQEKDVTNPFSEMRLMRLGLYLPRFCGEPDGGLAWPGQELPFAVIETGCSDSGVKIRSRAQHWVTRGGGSVYPPFSMLLISQIRLGVSVKITHQNQVVQSIEISAYRYTTNTRSSTHGRVVLAHSIVSFPIAMHNSDFLGVN